MTTKQPREPRTEYWLGDQDDLSALRALADPAQLRTLHLHRCDRVSDLSPLAEWPQLTTLDVIACNQVSDLSPLAELTQLTTLNLGALVRDLSPLVGLARLSALDLRDCWQVSDFNPLAELTQLTTLSLSGLYPTQDAIARLGALKDALRAAFKGELEEYKGELEEYQEAREVAAVPVREQEYEPVMILPCPCGKWTQMSKLQPGESMEYECEGGHTTRITMTGVGRAEIMIVS